MKAFAIILNLLAIIFSLIVLTNATEDLLLSLGHVVKHWDQILWKAEGVLRSRLFVGLEYELFIFIFPIVTLAALMNKYSMMDKYLVRFLSWNLSKVFLIFIWLGIIAILGIGIFLIIYQEHFFVWRSTEWGWDYKGFIVHMCLISLVVLGFVITFKNKRKLKQEQDQPTDS
jgi:hypothetical protein